MEKLGRGGPVEIATEVKVMPPLIRRGVPCQRKGTADGLVPGLTGFPRCSRVSQVPRPIPEATIGLIKKDHANLDTSPDRPRESKGVEEEEEVFITNR